MDNAQVKSHGKCDGRPCFNSQRDALTIAPRAYRCSKCRMWHHPKPVEPKDDKGVATKSE